MCGGKLYPFLAKLVTYDRCVVAANGHVMNINEPTMGVSWKYMSISDQISHLNGHLMLRNGHTIGVWWKIMYISCQFSHLR